MRMKTSLDHLPAAKRRELDRVVEILRAEFEEAKIGASSEPRKSGQIYKIILFGSYARGGWVDEPHTAKGYRSDYDILIVVSHKKLTDYATYWYKAEDRLINEPTLKTPVQFIVHTLGDVNSQLAEGRYFFSDITKEGIALHEVPGHKLGTPKPPTPQAAYEMAKGYYERGLPRSEDAVRGYKFFLNDKNLKDAAFILHQAAERAYHTLLLTITLYSPAVHNIEFLRSLAESHDPRLIDAWPRDQRRHRRMFQLLKRAYVEARYSEHYEITREELEWLEGCVTNLHTCIAATCEDRLEAMRGEV